MTFADRLEELRKAATPGKWKATECMDYWVEHSNEITPLDKGFNGIAHCGDIDWPNYENKQMEWEANARMISLLANNANAILELVRAADEYLVTQNKYAKALLSAEVAVENYSDPSVELRWQAVAMSNVSLAEKRLQAALAKLNGEQT